MKQNVISLLVCPQCQHSFDAVGDDKLRCPACGFEVNLVNGIPLFTQVPATIEPWEKVERGPDKGTAWRRANWKFLNQEVNVLPSDGLILDVGAGHGDFADIFQGKNYTSLDFVPYPEVDLVCDLGQTIPFKTGTFDAVILMNVLEHVYESRELVKRAATLVKPGGKIILTVPFLLKVHQAPFDFSRYTPFFLANMAEDAGMKVSALNGYYDTLYLLNESLGNLWLYSIDSQPKGQQFIAKSLVFIIQRFINLLGKQIARGSIRAVASEKNPAPVGYLVVLEKKA